jgi:DMSO/TMAO reductase YedYZ molybdopterin-dependent catalytic subunit
VKVKKEKPRGITCGSRLITVMVVIVVCLIMILPLDGPLFIMQSSAATAIGQQEGTACNPPTIVVPVMSKVITDPSGVDVDPETGFKVTGTPPANLDFQQYRLEVSGKVDRPLQLTYDEIRCLPKVTQRALLVCPGFFGYETNWSGTPLSQILEKAGVKEGARAVLLTAADEYFVVLPIEKATAEDALIAYELERKPVTIRHGFPVRAVLPGLEGNQWVKWLIKIEVE